ncbi:actin, partial [Aphelenchoides avenae]
MSGGVYGGDDVGALVFDVGSHSFRAGYGGEEFPKFDIPSDVGYRRKNQSAEQETIEEVASGGRARKYDYFVGTENLIVPRPNAEVANYMKDGMIEDWDMFESVLDHVYDKCLMAESRHHSVLFTEAPWNRKEKREQLTELMFEKYKVPAFFLVKNAVLAAYVRSPASGLQIVLIQIRQRPYRRADLGQRRNTHVRDSGLRRLLHHARRRAFADRRRPHRGSMPTNAREGEHSHRTGVQGRIQERGPRRRSADLDGAQEPAAGDAQLRQLHEE